MNDKRILQIIHQILLRAGTENSGLILSELRDILRRDGAPASCIDLVDKAMNNLPEACSLAQENEKLTPEDMAVAKQRGDVRRQREEEAARMGRC
ncbi:MAG: hypothetical protein E7240_03180 [Lachnospiraceae bacterium]|nr:hypothetical protein [Lachnospiraceae bacterium]